MSASGSPRLGAWGSIHDDLFFEAPPGNEAAPRTATLAGEAKGPPTPYPGFRRLSLQVLGLCDKAGLVKLVRVALDGTKLTANASRHTVAPPNYDQDAA